MVLWAPDSSYHLVTWPLERLVVVADQRFEHRRLHERVVEQIVADVIGGGYAPGTCLPTEPELAGQFGVSRAVIREAVRILAAKRLVTVKHGSGVWVRPADEWDGLDPLVLTHRLRRGHDARLIDHLLEARRIVEVEVAGLAAERCTAADLAELGGIVVAMRESLADDRRFAALDLAFHDGLFRAAQNPLLREMAGATLSAMRTARQLGTQDVERRSASEDGHEEILAALRAGDAARARQAMRAHIRQAEGDIKCNLRRLVSGPPVGQSVPGGRIENQSWPTGHPD